MKEALPYIRDSSGKRPPLPAWPGQLLHHAAVKRHRDPGRRSGPNTDHCRRCFRTADRVRDANTRCRSSWKKRCSETRRCMSRAPTATSAVSGTSSMTKAAPSQAGEATSDYCIKDDCICNPLAGLYQTAQKSGGKTPVSVFRYSFKPETIINYVYDFGPGPFVRG